MKNKEYYIRLGEAVQKLEEKNCPTDPSKWSYYKSQAKKKFDVYPSAYANGWASKEYGDAGGGWKKCAKEATDAQEKEFHTQLDKLVHKTFGKSPEEEKMDEKFDKTHLGILKYAYKDIDKINPSDPMYVRVAQMLDKLSKQELQQLIDADIKFISLLAKNRLSKKESVNESHFQVGDKVKMSHGGVGVVKSLDKEDGADDEKYYNIELPNGEVMKHAPNELTLAETDLKEGLFQDIMRAVKRGDGPFTLVVIKNNKVVKQVEVKTPQAIPANYSSLLKDFPNTRIRIEDATGKIVMGESLNEKLPNDFSTIPNNSRVDGMMKHLQHHVDVIGKNVKAGKGVYKKDLMKMANIIKALQMYESKSVNESSVEIGDIVLFPPANSAATVIDRFGRSVTLKLANGKKVKTVVDKIKLLAQDSVNEGVFSNIDIMAREAKNFNDFVKEFYKNFRDFPKDTETIKWLKSLYDGRSTDESINEGNAFTGALFKARKEGLTEFEFNGKMYPVHKLEEEEKEETLAESKLTKDSLKQIIKEEYHNVKTFMEEKYGFTPELGKVYSNLAAKPFLKEEEEEVVDEYDVENYQDLKEFVQFMAEYKSDINEAEYQGRKVKLGKIMQGDIKKFKVYVKNDKGNVVKVNFGQGGDAKGGTMRIRKDNPKARASFRARHNCDNPGPRWKARYWSCRKW